MDPWLLELVFRRLLLGSRRVGAPARTWLSVDARMVGIYRPRPPLSLSQWLLGQAHRLLRWHQLRTRLHWRRLSGRLLERRPLRLQQRCQQFEHLGLLGE